MKSFFRHDTSGRCVLTVCSYHIFFVFAVPFSQEALKRVKLPNFKFLKNFWKVWTQTFHLIYGVMGFKRIFGPLEAKIYLSKIFKKYKNSYFCPILELVKLTMFNHHQKNFSLGRWESKKIHLAFALLCNLCLFRWWNQMN